MSQTTLTTTTINTTNSNNKVDGAGTATFQVVFVDSSMMFSCTKKNMVTKVHVYLTKQKAGEIIYKTI
jgi:hypothetical protein